MLADFGPPRIEVWWECECVERGRIATWIVPSFIRVNPLRFWTLPLTYFSRETPEIISLGKPSYAWRMGGGECVEA